MKKSGQWLKVGQVKQAKSGRYYISLDADVNLPKGTTIQMKTPKEDIELLVKNGVLSEEDAAARLDRIPDFVKFNLVVPPVQKSNKDDIL